MQDDEPTPLPAFSPHLPPSIQKDPDAWRAYTTRRVSSAAFGAVCQGVLTPTPGDLVLVRVESIGFHRRLHLPNGRRRQLFVGNEIVVAYADRYAPQQFEARVPPDLGPCHLVASGGVAARVISKHRRVRGRPTTVRPIGLVTSGRGEAPLNVASWALAPAPRPRPGVVPTIAVLGTSMDCGKTTTAAYLARGLSASGKRVGYAKVTGTGAAGDPMLVADAGADPVLDFTDVGHVSTYLLSPEVVESIFLELLGHLQHAAVDVILLEIADGLLQAETAALAKSTAFGRFVDGCFLAVPNAMSAVAGADWLRDAGLPPIGLAGSIQTSPLQVREAREATGLPVYPRKDLATPAEANKILMLASAMPV